MNAADVFVKSLESEGVAYIFGVPGEENLRLLEAIRTSSIRFIVTRDEQAAGFMAATVGRLTGNPGVALSTLGPGATNFVTAVAYAQLGGMPTLFITGQKPIKRSKQGQFQIIDTVGMMSPLTKFSKQIVSADTVPALIREAFRLAKEERPGAVHLELPEDIAEEETKEKPLLPTRVRRPIAEEKAVAMAIDMIAKAKSPLLLVGAAANRKRTSTILTEFVKKTGIFFVNTQMGKGVIDERNDMYLGTAALSENDYVHCAIARADLIMKVGHDVMEKPPFLMDQTDTRSVIHVNFSPAIVDQIYFPQLEVVGDIANSIWQITQAITKQSHWDFSYYKKLQGHIASHMKSIIDKKRYPYSPGQIVADVRGVLSSSDVVCLDNGMYKIWFARNYETHEENTLILDNALASMGAGLPSAIATKLLHPQKKVVALCGDGGFMMNCAELETAKRLNLDLVVIILRDNGYAMIKWKQEIMKFPNFALDFDNPDFVSFAHAFGVAGVRVEKTGDLEKQLKTALSSKGITIIDTPIDYSDNMTVLVKELHEKTCIL